MTKRIQLPGAASNAALRVALERAIEALLAGIEHRRGEAGSMTPDEAQTVWNASCIVFRREGEWPFPGKAPWHSQSGDQVGGRPGVFRSKRLLDTLMAASFTGGSGVRRCGSPIAEEP